MNISQKSRRISKTRIQSSLKKSNAFLKKEEKISRKIENLKSEILNLENSSNSFNNYAIRLKKNQLAVLNGERKLLQSNYSKVSLVLRSHLEKNANLDVLN